MLKALSVSFRLQHSTLIFGLSLILVTVVTACGSDSSPTLPVPTVSVTPTVEPTIAPTPESTMTPVALPGATATVHVVNTPTPKPAPRPTIVRVATATPIPEPTPTEIDILRSEIATLKREEAEMQAGFENLAVSFERIRGKLKSIDSAAFSRTLMPLVSLLVHGCPKHLPRLTAKLSTELSVS